MIVNYLNKYRILYLTNHLNLGKCKYYSVKSLNDKVKGDLLHKINIDNVESKVHFPVNPELVPRKYIQRDENGNLLLNQTILYHLRWMLQKHNLKQDMFLLGYPGPLRRNLVFQFLELTQKELEYISLNRDTTESDLKQRREIKNKEATYIDQGAVRAAINGRVLVLDGVEHAERNVLPILNNLLENREMHLENGKFLMSAERFDKLLEINSKEELDKLGLIRVSEDFRVIALGLPTEKYRGTPLDPPFRSRFQSRNISVNPFMDILADLKAIAPQVDEAIFHKLISFGLAVNSPNSNLPDFPIDNLLKIANILNINPNTTNYEALCLLYPYKTTFSKENREKIKTLLDTLKIDSKETNKKNEMVIEKQQNSIKFSINNVSISIDSNENLPKPKSLPYVELPHQQNILFSMVQMYSVADFCLIGPKGVGKSILTEYFIDLIRQRMVSIYLYEDMSSRDLIQQRFTNAEGDTIWRDSPLVNAAKHGHICVLDGLNRLHKSTAAVLHRLIHNRELQLCDGTILLREDRFNSLLEEFTPEELQKKGILKMHPNFRIIALAESSTPSNSLSNDWLTPELLSSFLFKEIRSLTQSEEFEIMKKLYGTIDKEIHKVLNLSHNLRKSNDPIIQNLAGILSTRQLLKIAKHLSVYPINDENALHNLVQNTFLIKFMPHLPRTALEKHLKEAGILTLKQNSNKTKNIEVNNDVLKIGETEMKITQTDDSSKVPSTLFYEMPEHIALLEDLLRDFLIGEHILLVGNQGVGKNKLVDKLLQLMNKPREYIQLHRDTTVNSLTIQATLQNGHVIYEDSPLVKAIKNGDVLVIDEADKAPVNVTSVLRTLVESGEMNLSDGRRIVGSTEISTDSNLITTHPNFRIIVLANRPGYPFLGNDFFTALGDVFSCHAIDNPRPESEIFLLKKYGPSVPEKTLKLLVNAFGELRNMADEGLLNYPYSTREVVNLVKHLEKYKTDSMSQLVGNVLDFDKYSPEVMNQVTEVLLKNGLPVEAYMTNEVAEFRKKEIQLTIDRESGKDVSSPKHGKVDPKNDPHVGGNTWAGGTGGRDTAGLGGKGGPYRLDAGHTVHQLSDVEKDDIPESVKKAAAEMNRAAFEAKLKEIKMAKHDHKIYAQFSDSVKKQVQQLKAILNAMQNKSKERSWQKYQTSGELDDTRLIEGISGEKNIYKKRCEINPYDSPVQDKPNRLKIVVDVSGSMYRFNGYDGRLDRELEAVVMAMEAFEGFDKKIIYDIIGHSGESHEVLFVKASHPPQNDKERLETIKMMHAHSQFCWSGDNTLKATDSAIKNLLQEDNENSIVIILSDANFSRYGIPPKNFAEILTSAEPKVHAFVIFIGSLEEQASVLNGKMPAGHSYVCMNLDMLPQIMNQIFAYALH